MYDGCTLHFIELQPQGSRDQPSAKEFVKYIGQQLTSALMQIPSRGAPLGPMRQSH